MTRLIPMYVFRTYMPASRNGMIFRLMRATPVSYSPFCWDTRSRTWLEGDIGMGQFMSLPDATARELEAVGLKTSDLR